MAGIIFLNTVNIFLNQAYASILPVVIIVNCYDGDTCITKKGEKIRLACIDTPELRGPKAKPIEAQKSKDFLNNLVASEQISLKRITKDRFGRTVGELFKHGLNVQEMIVKKGMEKFIKNLHINASG